MDDPSVLAKERAQKSPGTLGDVLYAKSAPPVSEQDWAKLVQAIAGGDQLALHALYERAHRLVFTLAMRIAADRETAEELTVDVFHDVWRRASHYDPKNGTVVGWIMNQARSRAIDRVRFDQRKKRARPEGDDPTQPIDVGSAQDALELAQRGRLLRGALATLAPAEREAIEAAYFAELSHAEVAARLNEPLGTVKTRIRSGLHKLRMALAGGKS
jgi:RNA polymerase sigma-70 factor (ECF subfamily)